MTITRLIFLWLATMLSAPALALSLPKHDDIIKGAPPTATILSADNDILWDRNKNILTANTNATIRHRRGLLTGPQNIAIYYQLNNGNMVLERILAKGVAGENKATLHTDKTETNELLSQNFLGKAEEISIDLITKTNDNNDRIGDIDNVTMNRGVDVWLRNKKNEDMKLLAGKAITSRRLTKPFHQLSPLVIGLITDSTKTNNVTDNVFQQLTASQGVRLTNNNFTATSTGLYWFFDKSVGVMTGQNIKVISQNNDITAQKFLFYNQQKDFAVAQNGFRVITPRKDIIKGQRAYYSIKDGRAVMCGMVVIDRFDKNKKNQLSGECATLNLNSGESQIVGKDIERQLLTEAGVATSLLAVLAKDSQPQNQPTKQATNQKAKNLNNSDQQKGRVRAIIELE